MTQFKDLSADEVELILLLIPPEQILSVSQTNRLFRRLTLQNVIYWRTWFQTHDLSFSNETVEEMMKGDIIDVYKELTSDKMKRVYEKIESSKSDKILSLSFSNIKYLHKDIFKGLNNLQTLYLSNNQIETLPIGILEDLVIFRNCILIIIK